MSLQLLVCASQPAGAHDVQDAHQIVRHAAFDRSLIYDTCPHFAVPRAAGEGDRRGRPAQQPSQGHIAGQRHRAALQRLDRCGLLMGICVLHAWRGMETTPTCPCRYVASASGVWDALQSNIKAKYRLVLACVTHCWLVQAGQYWRPSARSSRCGCQRRSMRSTAAASCTGNALEQPARMCSPSGRVQGQSVRDC